MAFRILSEKELALLSDKERQIYETEYKDHCERKAFIERLEYLEGVEFPKVKPKKPTIKRIKSPDISRISPEQFTVKQPDIFRDGKRFSATAGKKPPVRKIGDVKTASLPTVCVPRSESSVSVAEYKLKPLAAFDMSSVKKPDSAVKVKDTGFSISALPEIGIASATAAVEMHEYSVKNAEGVTVCDTSSFKAVNVPDAKVELLAGNVVPAAPVAAGECSVSDYKCTDIPDVKIAEASVSEKQAGVQFKAEVPGAFVAKAEISEVKPAGDFKAELPGRIVTKTDVPEIKPVGDFRAELPGGIVTKTDVPEVKPVGDFRAELPGGIVTKTDVPEVKPVVDFKAELPGRIVAKTDVPEVKPVGGFKAELPSGITVKTDVPEVKPVGGFKAQIPGKFVAEVPDLDIEFNLKQPEKAALKPVQPEIPVVNCRVSEYTPEPVKEIAVPVIGELPTLNADTDIKTAQPFVAKPVNINVNLDVKANNIAEVKPFIAKTEIPDSSETLEKILGSLR